jgi:glycosyltransferase involved in cell wall biosynthesis
MRVFLSSNSRYPAARGGNGASRVNDGIAKGLAELGHDVLYRVDEGIDEPLPAGIIAVDHIVNDADIYHCPDPPHGKPWLRTHHAACERTTNRPVMSEHIVFVSQAHARSFGRTRFVWNGVDPSELTYSETKGDYFLFIVSHLSRARQKGIEIAIAIAGHFGARLIVGAAADGRAPAVPPNVEFRGLIDGIEKAELLAGARALLFPTQFTEAFGLVIAEAMFSGTPVIASKNGACPELITPDTGFTCETMDGYLAAVESLPDIRPADCRRRAETEFDYRVMARRYLAEYERELA